MNRQAKSRVTIFLTMTLVIVVPAFAQIPDGVSPGAADRTAEIEGRCPTFIWDSVPGAAFHELVGYRLSDNSELVDPAAVDLSKADQVLYAKVPGSAPAWVPELAECLTPGGNYVWFVRAVYLEEEGEVADASEWSYGRYFSISSTPSAVEVEEAMRVLRRYAETTADSEVLDTERAGTKRPAPSRLVAIQQQTPKSVTTAKTAIKATVPDATGETYGVVGISNSPSGAGMAAGNTNGGADLVLDGLEDGDLDTVFTQAGIDRTSSDEEWFSLINSGAGVLSLSVEGQIVADGSGLTAVDADTLDTYNSDYFAAANHNHFGQNWAGSAITGIAVENSSSASNSFAISGLSTAPLGKTAGLRGRAESTEGSGVSGHASAVTGVNYGVVGSTGSATGFGGFFNNSAGGIDIMAGGSGKVAQIADGDGLVKAAARVYCHDTSPVVNYSFNNIPGAGAVTIATGPSPFRCSVDFGVVMWERFWSVSPYAGIPICQRISPTSTSIGCFVYNGDWVQGNGTIMIAVF